MAANNDVASIGWTSASHPGEPLAASTVEEARPSTPQPAVCQACDAHHRRDRGSVEIAEFKARDARWAASDQLTSSPGAAGTATESGEGRRGID